MRLMQELARVKRLLGKLGAFMFEAVQFRFGERKRRLAVLSLLGYAVQTFMGLYTHSQVTTLRKEVDSLTDSVTTVIHRASVNEQALIRHSETLKLHRHDIGNLQNRVSEMWLNSLADQRFMIISSAVSRADQIILDTMLVMDALMQGKLSSAALNMNFLDELFEGVRGTAQSYGFDLLLTSPLDILQCQTTFIQTPDNSIRIFVHVPMADPEVGKMDVYRFVPFPMQISPDSFLHVEVSKKILAVSKRQNAFRVMDTDELASCTRVGATFLCEHGNAVLRPRPEWEEHDEEQCLYWLFQQHFDNVVKTCPSKITGITEQLKQIGPHKFIASTSNAHGGTVTCAKDNFNAALSMRTISVHEVEPGCRVQTDTHIFVAGIELERDDRREQDNAFNWPITEALRMLDGIEPDDLDLWRNQEMEEELPLPTGVADIKQWEALRVRRSTTDNNLDYLNKGAITVTVVIGLIGSVVLATLLFIRTRRGTTFLRNGLHKILTEPDNVITNWFGNAITTHVSRLQAIQQKSASTEEEAKVFNPATDAV